MYRRLSRKRYAARKKSRSSRSFKGRKLYSRRTTTRRPMSKRRILNITSHKKRNNIPPVNFNYQGLNPVPGPKLMGSDRSTYLLWRPTALTFDTDLTTDSARNAQTIFWRGIKEHAEIQTLGGAAWRWRRIIFSVKGIVFPGLSGNVETSNGFPRAMIEMSGDPPAQIRNGLEALLFQGQASNDWNNVFNARVDTNRVKLLYDKTRHLQSGNDRGKFFTFKQWIPLNKNMVYDDDERGKDESGQSYASTGNKGMGDVYFYDMFDCTTNDSIFQLAFNPQATLYWHEK
ncbi:capsid protein [Capybara genomovirus 4]|uniref:Capsid protein n=1 Tax=Capybara genomovirus 4 TaxID=2582943 RepID=A0A4P8W429_9VIRU|nr:capsid protein [Capybara genomovirus 4]QCS35888.1 capsid protein [Capybara genomovirus 4]